MRSPSTSIPEWQHYLETRYRCNFTQEAALIIIEAVEAAETQRGNLDNLITVNSKELLIPLRKKQAPLASLYFGNYTGDEESNEKPRWHEPQSHADESDEARAVYGLTRPSIEFASIIETAASLTDTTPDHTAVTPWHIAFSLLSSGASGFKWQLEARGSSISSAAVVLRRTLRSQVPQLEPFFKWDELEQSHEPDPEIDEGEESETTARRWSREFHDLRNPKKYRWSTNCAKILDKLWHSHALQARFSRQDQRRNKRFNPTLTPRILFLALLHFGSEDRPENRDAHQLPAALFKASSRKPDQLEELLREEFVRGGSEAEEKSGSNLVGKDLADTIALANEIRLATGNDSLLCTRHVVAALMHPSMRGGTCSRILRSDDNIDRQPLLDALGREVTSAHLNRSDKADGWLPWLKRLQEGMVHPLPDSQFLPSSSTLIGGKSNFRRGASEDELCLNIGPISGAIAQTFHGASDQDDFVFALYGPWGRGKTELARKVDKQLNSHGYTTIFFSAWKYPSRPEVWVHLYQEISKVALKGNWREKIRLSFQTAILRHGWFSLISSLVLLLLSRFVAPLGEWFAHGLGVIGLLMLGFFGIRTYSAGKLLHQRYFSLPDHADKLGLQAVIGTDLANLLKVWVAPSGAASDGKPKPADERINFHEGGAGLWWRNLSIILLIATCLTLVVQIWRSKPLERADLTPPALQELNTGIKELGSSLHSLESRIEEVPDNIEKALAKLPQLPLSGGGPSKPETSAPPTGEATPPPHSALQPAPPWPPSKLEIEINIAPGASAPAVASGKPATTDPTASPTPPTETGCMLVSLWQQFIQLPWQKLIVAALLLLFAATGWTLLVIATKTLKLRPQKLLLVVDDLDRCEPEQMLAVIESLRMFLDDKAMSVRMQVMMLLDLKILEFALKNRCRAWRWPRLDTLQATREQREKWFVAELTLPPLSATDLKNTVEGIVGREARAAKQHSPQSTNPTESRRSQDADATMQAGAVEEQGLDPAPSSAPETPGKDPNPSSDAPSASSGDGERPAKESSSPWLDDCTYHDDEQEQIKQAFSALDTDGLTPRRIRSLTLRYQLAKLLLRHLKEEFTPSQILTCLTKPDEAHDDTPPVIQQVAKSVLQ